VLHPPHELHEPGRWLCHYTRAATERVVNRDGHHIWLSLV